MVLKAIDCGFKITAKNTKHSTFMKDLKYVFAYATPATALICL
jgi:hypothetical protein